MCITLLQKSEQNIWRNTDGN